MYLSTSFEVATRKGIAHTVTIGVGWASWFSPLNIHQPGMRRIGCVLMGWLFLYQRADIAEIKKNMPRLEMSALAKKLNGGAARIPR